MHGLTYKAVGRREVLKAASVGFVAALIEALAGAGCVAQAATLVEAAPEVEKLAIRFITDNTVDRYAHSAQIPGVVVERRRADERPGRSPHDTLTAEWGLSMLAESTAGAAKRTTLIDFGYTAEALLMNLKLLGIDPAALDAMILSHGHYDHFGGLSGFLAATRGHLKPGLPFFVGGEDCFCQRQYSNGGDYGVLDRPAILAAGLTLMLAERPALAADHAVVSGLVPQVTAEKPLRSTKERTGIVAGLGCDPAKEPKEKNTGDFVADDFQHEVATSYVVKGKGLVVLSSCSHRGIMNAVRQAQAASGVEKIHAIVGGFHLVPPLSDDYVRETVMAMKALEPTCIIAAHCSGETFYDIARAEMPGRIVRAAVGTSVTFAA
jgi:7,8-dihydropterin-6-yl-methyl-4-(beta-D-ribofuranosyl)aminobenzene 5'-phosphate synthase